MNTNYQIKILNNKETAQKVFEFLTGENAFDQTWAPNEKEIVRKACFDSIEETTKNHRYWYIEDDSNIIAVIGVRENKYGSGGYEMDQDYVAVHKKYRKLGLATKLLKEIEDYVKSKDGRYIHVLTCDIDSYKAARRFYEKMGYKQVAEMPNYYVVGEGRIDYYKEF